MIQVSFPEPQFKLKTEGGKRYLFDAIRKSWILLTEEEWVRQNFVRYLIDVLHYPSALVALEKEIEVAGLRKRFDILVYDRSHKPWLLVECKAPSVPLDESVLQQALRYNMTVPVPFIVLTNGHHTTGWSKKGEGLQLLNTLPSFEEC